MKRSVFAKGKIHADRGVFHLLHLDLEFSTRLKWLQITSERYFMLGLAVHIACSFLEMKAHAVSGHSSFQQNLIGWKQGLWIWIASIQETKPSKLNWSVVRTENAPPLHTNGCTSSHKWLPSQHSILCWHNTLLRQSDNCIYFSIRSWCCQLFRCVADHRPRISMLKNIKKISVIGDPVQ